MIISASRRTDIPAFLGSWFMDCLREQTVQVVNPMNRKQISTVSLAPEDVDCFVFWTKDPAPFFKYLREVDSMGHNYYFQFTLNHYGKDWEPGLRPVESRVDAFKILSEQIGPERVIWRYDPIVITQKQPLQWHYDRFGKLVNELSGYTRRCMTSFLQPYRKIEKKITSLGVQMPTNNGMISLASELAEAASERGIELSSCAHPQDLSAYGVSPGSCIDKALIERLIGKKVTSAKDRGQREGCGCVMSRDIGEYRTCGFKCVYCYAQ